VDIGGRVPPQGGTGDGGQAFIPVTTDVWTNRLAVLALGLVALAATVGLVTILLVHTNTSVQVPTDAIVALGSAAVGGLAGLLVPAFSNPGAGKPGGAKLGGAGGKKEGEA
jgi:hypothetical protein